MFSRGPLCWGITQWYVPLCMCIYMYIHISHVYLIACNDTLEKNLEDGQIQFQSNPQVVNRFPKQRSTGYITMDAADNIKEVKAQF